jgi:phenylpropionate dioxygenase-like ring-hydroxylating dioxygenase large terminal subunit
MNKIVLSLFAGVMAALPATLNAHHSAAVLYLLDQQITVEGTVTRFTLGNPHARIFMTVKAADGTSAEWMAEGGSRTVLLRNGWTGEEVKAGDAIKIIGNPSRDGSNVIHWERLVLPDGQELWGEDIPDEESLEELRQRRR